MANQASRPRTIKQCFNDSLPFIQHPTRLVPFEFRPGTKTSQIDAPKFWISTNERGWSEPAHNTLRPMNMNALQEQVSWPEPSMRLACEADVVRAAALYLLHPINQVLSARYPNDYRCNSEVAGSGVRGDVSLLKLGGRRTFAIVEFKRSGIISPMEFADAQRTLTGNPNTHAAEISQHVQNVIAADNGDNRFSAFEGNSFSLMKQAAAYAVQYSTRFVAIFGWDYLVLVYFPELDMNLREPEGCGNYCEITMIPNNPPSPNLRAALLGFLFHAYDATPFTLPG
ncbi:hypothetical protein F5B22DRAFT_603366 [Xylaria bambusicola]|uniref:uncharacterized protein n=1 Tax=Xylaria bambusicola TaxID=326684 RepID=UPI002007A30B|nr:uncharacterized protein F5B22DRAFT_603366 [Xylaria bambusicola]KAI0517555.1 hypothetical protein F5B22DRAFT_603366 [Xylaria bambusicola]